MLQADWVGAPEQRPFKDIPNQRDLVAEEKARLLLKLGGLLGVIPDRVKNGYVQTVRQWRQDRDSALKIAGNKRASVNDINSAISRMERWMA